VQIHLTHRRLSSPQTEPSEAPLVASTANSMALLSY
jgi:hypothetical protein